MNWKHLVAICVIAACPSFALAAKPTKADVQKVVATISADKAKVKTYCDMAKLEEQMSKLDEKKDAKKLQELGKQLDALAQKLGPEYVKLMESMQDIDPDSAEGKELTAAFEPLDKQCGKA
jgi:hypothetical protein